MAINKLKGKIVEAGYSQRTLASALGMSINTLNCKINGKRPFNTVEIRQLCDMLKIENDTEKADIFLR